MRLNVYNANWLGEQMVKHSLLLLLLLLLLATPAFAGPFAEIGVGAKFGECDCERLDNPVGIVAVGYRVPKTGLSLEVEHRSSLVEKDYGQNLVSIRYRWEGKD